jgi:two-component system, cell cycle sensor histidine kinase and response regulator CckA
MADALRCRAAHDSRQAAGRLSNGRLGRQLRARPTVSGARRKTREINESFTDSVIVMVMGAATGLCMKPPLIFSGRWRWAAGACAVVCAIAAIIAVAAPGSAGWNGLALLFGIAVVGALLLFTLWPRENLPDGARRIAEAAAASHIAWAITGTHGAVVNCNEAYRRLVGANPSEAPPPPELALGTETSAPMLYRLTRSAAARQPREEIIGLASGSSFAASVRPLKGAETAWWFVPALPNRASRQIATSQLSLTPSSLLKDAPIGVATISADGIISECNNAFAIFFGMDVPGRSLAELVDSPDRPRIRDLLAGTAVSRNTPIEIRPAAKPDSMAELYASPMDSTDESRLSLYLIDVSALKALEAKFAQAQKMQAVGQLAGGVAHDFNNLLTVIIGNSELLLMRHQASDPSFRDINDIRQTAIRAANLVRQLLAFSRQQTMQPRVVDLGAGLRELGELLRRLLPEGVALKLETGKSLWPVHVDEAQVNNAVINLVVNARDAMSKGGAVILRASNQTLRDPVIVTAGTMPAGDYVRVDVSDTGVGIPKENLDKIFDPFFTTKPVGEGTGLGLATVYGIVKQTGGFIGVESELGKGTTFSIYLPRHHGEVEAREQIAPAGDITGRETILLVEDEDAVRSFAARALKQRGYEVMEAAGGEQALEIMKKRADDIELLITDVVMPNMDGPTLVRAVKKLKPNIHVIYMSGYAEEAFRRHDEKAQDLHFLPKPFGLKQLAIKVKDVLSGAPPH